MTDDDASAEEWVPDDPARPAELATAAATCRGCELWQDATQAVFPDGPEVARLMLVGEQPGDQEDLAGEPFVGPAGRVVRTALDDAGIDVSDVYLTNAVKHFRRRRRGRRRIHQKPDVRHLTACHPWLAAEVALVGPAVVVCLGASAGRAVLGRPVRIGAERGEVLTADAGPAAVVTYHPSAILRTREKDDRRALHAALVADLELAASVPPPADGGGR